MGKCIGRSMACVCLPLLVFAIATGEVSYAGTESRTVVVAIDRGGYLSRDTDLLRDQVEEAAHSRPYAADFMGGPSEVTVVFHDLHRDTPFRNAIEKRFAGDSNYVVAETSALSIDVSYSPQALKARGMLTRDRDIRDLSTYLDSLKIPLPGLVIETQAESAIVRGAGSLKADDIRKALGPEFDITPLTKTSWRVAWKKEGLAYLSPAARLLLNQTIELSLRELLSDPLGQEPEKTDTGVTITIANPEQHGAFIAAVNKAFAQNSDFVLATHPALKMQVRSRVATDDRDATIPTLPNSSWLLDEVYQLANPPVEVTVTGNAVSVHARDPAHNADRAEIVREALADRTDLVIAVQSDQSLLISLAPGAHLVPSPPAISPERLMQAVKARVRRAKREASDFSAIGADRVRVQFESGKDAAAFRSALSEPVGISMRMVDDPDSDATPPPRGDKKFLLPDGSTIWVRPEAIVTGDMIADAQPGRSRYSESAIIRFRLTTEGRVRFGAATREYVGRRFVILVDGVALEAPVIREPITGGSGEISGNFTSDSAEAIADTILARKDDVPLKIVDEVDPR